MKQLTSGWRFRGTAQIFSRANIALSCGFPSNPVGSPNGTPTGSVRYRCRMMTATPSAAGSTADPKPWHPVDPNHIQLPKDHK